MNIIDSQTLSVPQHYHTLFMTALECEKGLKISKISG